MIFPLLIGRDHLLRWPLLPGERGSYMSVAWEMGRQSGGLMGQLNGALYGEKLPFLFRLIHLDWALGRVGPTWPRVILALAAEVKALLAVPLIRRPWPGKAPAASAV